MLGWFRPKKPEHFRLGRFPVSNIKSDEGHFYQFPVWNVPGFKIGRYHHLKEQGPADGLSREPTAADEAALRAGLQRFLPRRRRRSSRACGPACSRTRPTSISFLIRCPDFEEVVVASPCSGHGFKFSSAIGEILADLAMDHSRSSISRLSRLIASHNPSSSAERAIGASKAGDPAQDSPKAQKQYRVFDNSCAGSPNAIAMLTRSRMTVGHPTQSTPAPSGLRSGTATRPSN